MTDPYVNCPALETQSFILRLVSENDAEDLLYCYSDPRSQDIFNSDKCTSDFRYNTVREMRECIGFWLYGYAVRAYIRFSVVDKDTLKAVGAVEMFGEKGFLNDYDGGLLRIDLASKYETSECISEILDLASLCFYDMFNVDFIVTKARPGEINRLNALESAGYKEYDWNDPERENYYGKGR